MSKCTRILVVFLAAAAVQQVTFAVGIKETARLTISGPGLSQPLEVTDEHALALSNVFAGTFIGDPAVNPPDRELPRYSIVFDVQAAEGVRAAAYTFCNAGPVDWRRLRLCAWIRRRRVSAQHRHDPSRGTGRPMAPRGAAVEPGDQPTPAVSSRVMATGLVLKNRKVDSARFGGGGTFVRSKSDYGSARGPQNCKRASYGRETRPRRLAP
jgi:hypothetical protein